MSTVHGRKIGLLAGMASALGINLNKEIDDQVKKAEKKFSPAKPEKGLSEEAVAKLRAMGKRIVYAYRKVQTSDTHSILIDMAGKPYLQVHETGMLFRNFQKSPPKWERAKSRRIDRQKRSIAVCDYFLAPRQTNLSRKRLAALELTVKLHQEKMNVKNPNAFKLVAGGA